jgi:hypothetical protein
LPDPKNLFSGKISCLHPFLVLLGGLQLTRRK